MKIFKQKKEKSVEGCVEGEKGVCRPNMIHRLCLDCGRLTCFRRIIVDSQTLRRRYIPCCDDCRFQNDFQRADEANRKARTEFDWARLTAPIENDLLECDVLPEQYAGKNRAAVRAFLILGSESAVVPNTTAESLQASIHSLGLQSQVYAETRDDETVLRRIQAQAPPVRRSRRG